jgi:hypothetical protein
LLIIAKVKGRKDGYKQLTLASIYDDDDEEEMLALSTSQ